MSTYSRSEEDKKGISKILEAIRLAFTEFLTIPTCIIIGFLLLAAGLSIVDRREMVWLKPLRDTLTLHIFADAGATSSLLGTISSGINFLLSL